MPEAPSDAEQAALLELIERYCKTVARVVAALREATGEQDLLAAWRRGALPRVGNAGGFAYRFHGVGCRVAWGEPEVDFDFGPDGRHDGFDAWRLWGFERAEHDGESEPARLEQIRAGLEALVRAGVLMAPELAPSPHLLYRAPGPASK